MIIKTLNQIQTWTLNSTIIQRIAAIYSLQNIRLRGQPNPIITHHIHTIHHHIGQIWLTRKGRIISNTTINKSIILSMKIRGKSLTTKNLQHQEIKMFNVMIIMSIWKMHKKNNWIITNFWKEKRIMSWSMLFNKNWGIHLTKCIIKYAYSIKTLKLLFKTACLKVKLMISLLTKKSF